MTKKEPLSNHTAHVVRCIYFKSLAIYHFHYMTSTNKEAKLEKKFGIDTARGENIVPSFFKVQDKKLFVILSHDVAVWESYDAMY